MLWLKFGVEGDLRDPLTFVDDDGQPLQGGERRPHGRRHRVVQLRTHELPEQRLRRWLYPYLCISWKLVYGVNPCEMLYACEMLCGSFNTEKF